VCVADEFSWLGISAREELLCEFVSETMGFIKNEESLLPHPTPEWRGISDSAPCSAVSRNAVGRVVFGAGDNIGLMQSY